MINETNIVNTFPTIVIPNKNDGLPIEISLIAQLGHGAGNHLFQKVASRQTHHSEFIDELDEPSAKLAGTNFSLGDTTSLYSFIVGPKGHPFHRHAGHRIFTAISGSGGAQHQEINTEDTFAQVLLGADDKHLKFRSCVAIKKKNDTNFNIILGTSVHCNNLFGKIYINSIDLIHRKYITPSMLKRAADYMILQLKK